MTTCQVAVVGAGLSGLAATDFLKSKGVDVMLFEAQNRVGGRVYTTRTSSNEQFEEGAFSFATIEKTLMSYIQRFSLQVTPQSTIDKQFRFMGIQGHFSDKGTFLEGKEQMIVLSNLLSYYLPNVPADDTISFADGLRKAGASEKAIAWLDDNTLPGLQGDGLETASALAVKKFMAQYTGATTFNTIQGGNDLLPQAFAKGLTSQICLNSPIAKIEQLSSFYRLTSTTQTVFAQKVILALPLAGLQQIEFDPPLPNDKQQAILKVPYTSCSRISVVAPPNLFGQIRGGVFAITDHPAGWFREQTLFQANPQQNTVFDISFVGEEARYMDALSDDDRQEEMLEGLNKFYPNISSKGMETNFFSWDNVPWVKGGYCYFPPGTISLQSILSRPEGGLHFAGEHTSDKFASMNGALESGLRAANEVLSTLKKI